MISECLDKLDQSDDARDYPARLLILMATVSFQPFNALLEGIDTELRNRELDIPLIGGSVGAVIDGDQILPQGVQLICLASRCLDARVGAAPNVVDPGQRAEAIKALCSDLGLADEPDDPNPDGNRFLFCFLPGFQLRNGTVKYDASEIQVGIRDATKSRIPMFGAATGDDFARKQCWQFSGRNVVSDDAVVALVNCDMRFGIAMSHGLQGTGDFVFARELTEDGHGIKRLERQKEGQPQSLTPSQLIEEYRARNELIVFGGVTPDSEGERIILYPRQNPDDGSIAVNRPTKNNWPMEIMRCEPERIQMTVAEAAELAQRQAVMDVFHLAAMIVFPCSARRESSEEIGLKPAEALRNCQERYPGVPLLGALVFGEIGVGQQGRSQLRNWCVSALCLSDELTPNSIRRRGNVALAVAAPRMMLARSTSEVLEIAMQAIYAVGLPGAMVSLVYRDHFEHKRPWVVLAQQAIGAGWKSILPMTKRRLDEKDILATMVRQASRKEKRSYFTSDFVRDARTHKLNDQAAVKKGNIISYYVSVLTDASRPVGVLQVGLGDMSNTEAIPADLQSFLSAVSGQIATALGQIVRMTESKLLERCDLATSAILTQSSKNQAAQAFINTISRLPLFERCLIHIRLPKQGRLELIAGAGKYYEFARQHRRFIPMDDISPTAKSFNQPRPIVVNDTAHDDDSKALLNQQLENADEEFRAVLGLEKSYVNMPIIGPSYQELVGVLHIGSEEVWFFSESIVRLLVKLCQRLHFVLTYMDKAEKEKKKAAEIQFLSAITPPLERQDLKLALRDHASKIALAAKADVVSFFLWDHERMMFVLRGQYGWKTDCVGKAMYKPHEGMTGRLACETDPQLIPDLMEWKRTHGQQAGKYEQEMFGSRADTETRYEVIAIPFTAPFDKSSNEGDYLGILTLHNANPAEQLETRFATEHLPLLGKIKQDIASYILAMRADHESVAHSRNQYRLEKLASDVFLNPTLDPATRINEFCRYVCQTHKVEACGVYLDKDSDGHLAWGGGHGFAESIVKPTIDQESLIQYVFNSGIMLMHPQKLMPKSDSALTALQSALSTGAFQSLLVLPLQRRFASKRCGVIVMANISSDEQHEHPWFTKSDFAAFQRYARYLTSALEADNIAVTQMRDAQRIREHARRLSQLTHDFRTPISAMRSGISTILDLACDETTKSIAAEIESSCQILLHRATNALNNIANGSQAEFHEVAISEIIDSALSRLNEQPQVDMVTISTSYQFCYSLLCRKDILTDAFSNLLCNSVDALASVTERRISIDVRQGLHSEDLIVSITDTGAGISAEKLQQLNGGGYHEGRESGVSLARDGISTHGGTLAFTCGMNGGTTATVTLPLTTSITEPGAMRKCN